MNYKINKEIDFPQIRLVGEDFKGVVMSITEARKIAESKELDLILINKDTNPPIVRLCDYGKFLYELKKKNKGNKNNVSVKEIQLSVNIAQHDLETKVRHAIDFLKSKNKVKVILKMRGRELTRRDENKKPIYQFIQMVEGFGTPDSLPKDEGTKCFVMLSPKK